MIVIMIFRFSRMWICISLCKWEIYYTVLSHVTAEH